MSDIEYHDLKEAVLDIAAHATPYGDIPDDPGWVGVYLVSAGALHRALGILGYSAPSCQAEARVELLEAENEELKTRIRSLETRTSDIPSTKGI